MSIESLHNEAELVEAMQGGSEEAFTTLYRHYSPQLYLNILAMIRDPWFAEEIVQDLFTRVWQKKERTGFNENFAGYLYRIGQNLVHDFFRKLQRERILLERFRYFAEENVEHIDDTLYQKHSPVVFQKAIEKLSPQQKRAYELVKINKHTYKKAAEIMGISPHTVKEYIVAAHKTIHKYISSHLNSFLVLLIFFHFGR